VWFEMKNHDVCEINFLHYVALASDNVAVNSRHSCMAWISATAIGNLHISQGRLRAGNFFCNFLANGFHSIPIPTSHVALYALVFAGRAISRSGQRTSRLGNVGRGL